MAVRQYCAEGWPEKHKVDPALIPYWKEQAALTICEDLLLYNGRIVVSKALRRETMEKIREGHQGMEKCRSRIMTSVWWPFVNHQITHNVMPAVRPESAGRSLCVSLHCQRTHGKW